MKTIIHIGHHKTGTTSLQNYLVQNHKSLIKRGLYYPQTLTGIITPSHFPLNVYALDKDRFSAKKEALLKQQPNYDFLKLQQTLVTEIAEHYQQAQNNNCEAVLWSNEGLYLLNSDEELQRLIDLFSPHSSEIVCVCCFRDIDSYRESYTKQLLKNGLSLSQDPTSYRYLEVDSWLFDFKQKKQLIINNFSNVIFFDYSAEQMVEHFMRYIGFPITEESAVIHRMNVSPSWQELTKPA